ncbi:hypothetical protein, partial [Phocaeicola vulgatus]|uniref:hypothetical protein n=1 Tax=Phocaeicola vulgatus TaxID=821 RepID=UPI003D266E63
MNLTLAGSQSDFVRNHVNIIPAPVKDIFEKSSDEVPDRTAMKLYRSYHTVIGCNHFSTGIVSTQFRASPFERALFSALNRVLLIN